MIGVDYPERIINLEQAGEKNCNAMKMIRESLISNGAPINGPQHCRPSNDEEIRQFFWLVEEMI